MIICNNETYDKAQELKNLIKNGSKNLTNIKKYIKETFEILDSLVTSHQDLATGLREYGYDADILDNAYNLIDMRNSQQNLNTLLNNFIGRFKNTMLEYDEEIDDETVIHTNEDEETEYEDDDYDDEDDDEDDEDDEDEEDEDDDF